VNLKKVKEFNIYNCYKTNAVLNFYMKNIFSKTVRIKATI